MHITKFASLTIAASAALALALTGCTNASTDAKGDTTEDKGGSDTPALPTEVIAPVDMDPAAAALLPADITKAGVIRVATDPTYAPFEVYAADNKTIVGIDVDLANGLGQILGVDIEFVPSSFDTIIPGLSSGKYDMSMSGFSVTDERKESADFVVYQQSGSGVAVPIGNPKKLSMDPMTLCGITIGSEKGSLQGMEMVPEMSEQCVAAGKDPIDLKLFPGTDKAITALSSGRIDGVVQGATGLGYQAKITGAFEVADGLRTEVRPTGAILPKGSDLTPAITAAMEKLVTLPAYHDTFQKWGLDEANEVPAELVAVK